MSLQHHGFSFLSSSSIVFPSLLTIGWLVLASSRGYKTKESFNQKVARTIRIAVNTMEVTGSDLLPSLFLYFIYIYIYFFITYRPLTACSVSLFHQIELSYLHFLFSHVLWGLWSLQQVAGVIWYVTMVMVRYHFSIDHILYLPPPPKFPKVIWYYDIFDIS